MLKNLRAMRQAKGWSIRDLANRAGVAVGTIYYLETSDQSPRLHIVYKVADALQVDPAALIARPGDPRPTGR